MSGFEVDFRISRAKTKTKRDRALNTKSEIEGCAVRQGRPAVRLDAPSVVPNSEATASTGDSASEERGNGLGECCGKLTLGAAGAEGRTFRRSHRSKPKGTRAPAPQRGGVEKEWDTDQKETGTPRLNRLAFGRLQALWADTPHLSTSACERSPSDAWLLPRSAESRAAMPGNGSRDQRRVMKRRMEPVS